MRVEISRLVINEIDFIQHKKGDIQRLRIPPFDSNQISL